MEVLLLASLRAPSLMRRIFTHQKCIKTNLEMFLNVVGCLLIGVLGAAVSFVHELAVFPPTWYEFDIRQCAAASAKARRDLVLCPLRENMCRHRRSLDPLEACLVAGQALLDHAELNSETFVLRRLARHRQRGEHLPGSCNRSRTRLLSLGDSFRIQQDRTSLRKVHRTTLGTCQCVPDKWRKLHTQLQESCS